MPIRKLVLGLATSCAILALALLLFSGEPNSARHREPMHEPPGKRVADAKGAPRKELIRLGKLKGTSISKTKGQFKITGKAPVRGFGGSIRGVVLDDQTGLPIPGAKVWISGQRSQQTKSDKAGRYLLHSQPGAKLIIAAKARGYAPVELPAVVGSGLKADGPELRLKPVPTGAIEGRIECSGPLPEHFTVYVGLDRYAQLGTGGRFRIDKLRLGSQRLGAVVGGPEAGVPLRSQSIIIKEGETTQVVIKLEAPATIAGTIRLASGAPLPFAKLILGRLIIVAKADGSFRFDQLPPGSYEIRLNHRDVGPQQLGSLKLRPGEKQERLEFVVRIKGAASIGGRLLGAAAKQSIRLKQLPDPRKPSRPAGALAIPTRKGFLKTLRVIAPDAQGRYKIVNLGPGRYRVEVRIQERVLHKDVEIRGGEALRVDLGP